MSDSYNNHQGHNGKNSNNHRDDGANYSRGNRGSWNKESGGFRIRLSDNEMRAARTLQEAFNLRSTVAVLGFAIRTLAQLLEEGKLDAFLSEYKAQPPSKGKEQFRGRRFDKDDKTSEFVQKNKPNPFARPDKPQTAEAEENPEISPESVEETDEKDKDVESVVNSNQ